jgi:putative heme-binding domain-containing protein
MKLPFSLLLLVSGLAVVQAQDHGSISGNPFSTPEDAAVGAKSFRSQCAACHGFDAAGGSVAPSLVTGTFKNGGSDAALFRTITGGVPGTAMVSFNLNGREVWQIITFLRSVNIAKAADHAPGDAAKGALLFDANGCASCHTNGSAGGFSGPDLSEIGSRRSLQQLESSLVEPDADVDPDYWSVRARTKAGQIVTGIRMNEDMDSLQIRDPQGGLRSLRKAELASFEIMRTSPMPAFKTRLTAAELQDLVAYLASLRAQPIPEEPQK